MTKTGVGLADYLPSLLSGVHSLGALELPLADAWGSVLAEQVRGKTPLPPFDRSLVDGYAVRSEDLTAASAGDPVRLSVAGNITSSSWRPARVSPGTCFSVASGAALPTGADAVVPGSWTDEGLVTVEVQRAPSRGAYVRWVGSELALDDVIAEAGTVINAALIGLLAAAGVDHIMVRPKPRVVVLSVGDELVGPGNSIAPGQVIDANSYALSAAIAEAGAQPYRVGVMPDSADVIRASLDDHALRADMIITSGGTGRGPGDILRRTLERQGSVNFTQLSVYPTSLVGFGRIGADATPIICLPGDNGTALIGFEFVARPLLRRLAGLEPVFRTSVKATAGDSWSSPRGLREFRPVTVTERRGGGHVVYPLASDAQLYPSLAKANGLAVIGERIVDVTIGSTVDILMINHA